MKKLRMTILFINNKSWKSSIYDLSMIFCRRFFYQIY